VWGPGDTTLVLAMADMVRAGRFRWIGGGRQLTSTTHVDNCVRGLRLAAERGPSGTVYFVTDGPPVVWREFITALLRTAGVEPPDKSVPEPVARALADGGELAWRALRLKGSPPLTRFAYWVSTRECTLDDSRARAVLGYAPVVSREDGLARLAGAAARA
jgi:nucleoside-diphosphate-sugar epimerase